MVGQNSEGHWVVRDGLGLKAGIFSSLESALHFAKEEARAGGSGVVLSATAVELGLDLYQAPEVLTGPGAVPAQAHTS